MTAYRVAYVGGEYRVHSTSCRDALREDEFAFLMFAETDQQAAEELWGDIASDEYEQGSPEWQLLCREYHRDTRYLPCTKRG